MRFPARNTILVIRFSSMGDVAMTVPVLRNLLLQHSSLHVIMLSQQHVSPLFNGIDRLRFIGADFKGEHKGLLGLWRLFMSVYKETGSIPVADLHGVLRSAILSFFFKMHGSPVRSIDKGREQKRALTRRNQKIIKPLIPTFDRYKQVFNLLGLESVPCKLFLFGASGQEAAQLASWEQEFPATKNMAGQLELNKELQVISNLDLMITMDSANMHLASLVNTPVISIWGATHPFAGFLGWGQSFENVVQADLSCRPCSVFGNKTCFRGDYACLQEIQPEQIVQRVRAYLCIS